MNLKGRVLDILKDEKDASIHGRLYYLIQIELAYNSNRIEGSSLTHEQTRYIFETMTVLPEEGESINVNDLIETVNHFKAVDYVLETADQPLTEDYIKELHKILKTGTADSRKSYFAVGDYKKIDNMVGGNFTTPPQDVPDEMVKLMRWYNAKDNISTYDIAEYHKRFESIHPFQDGNGRVGRLIMFKECLKNNITPFIIADNGKAFYYRGLQMWDHEPGFLLGTIENAQNNFKALLNNLGIDVDNSLKEPKLTYNTPQTKRR